MEDDPQTLARLWGVILVERTRPLNSSAVWAIYVPMELNLRHAITCGKSVCALGQNTAPDADIGNFHASTWAGQGLRSEQAERL